MKPSELNVYCNFILADEKDIIEFNDLIARIQDETGINDWELVYSGGDTWIHRNVNYFMCRECGTRSMFKLKDDVATCTKI